MIDNYVIQISVLIIFLAFVLFYHLYKSNKNILFLSSFLVIYAIQSASTGLVIHGGPVWLLAILFVHFIPLYYLSPVLFYFSVRASLTDSMEFKKRDLLHLIPFLVILIATVPYYFKGYDYKYELASGIMNNFGFYQDYDRSIIYTIQFNQFARPVVFLGYLAASLVSAHRFLPKYRSSYGPVLKQYRFQLRSIYLAVLVFSIQSIIQLILSVDFFYSGSEPLRVDYISFMLYLSGILYLGIPFYILISPRFLYGMPQVVETDAEADSETGPPEGHAIPMDGRPKTNHFTENENFNRLSEEIMEYIHTEKPFLNEKFSVVDICTRLKVPRHHVQYCLNMIMNTSFSEMKNELRIHHAMELMKMNSVNKLSIEGIGRQSGFASNSSFYACFKEETGMTPSKWMEIYASATTDTVTQQP